MRTRFFAVLLLLPLCTSPLIGQTATVDHAAYDALLRKHVVNGLVDYDAFARDSSFTYYLRAMETVDPTVLSSDERVAFWINLYNAYTIRLITTHNERESIRNISRTLGILRLKGPWTQPIVKAAGRTLSLDQVQYEMIRPQSSDPRIHFALSCGARSCAPLRSEAYTGAQLDQQLHDQGRIFLTTDSTWNRLDVKSRTSYRHQLFRYFSRDFGETRREVAAFLSQWYNDTTSIRVERFDVMRMPRSADTSRTTTVAADTSRFEMMSQVSLLKSGRYNVEILPFDWSLNTLNKRSTK